MHTKCAEGFNLRSSDVNLSRQKQFKVQRTTNYIWNSLPNDLKELENAMTFKLSLKKARNIINKTNFQKEAAVIINKKENFLYFQAVPYYVPMMYLVIYLFIIHQNHRLIKSAWECFHRKCFRILLCYIVLFEFVSRNFFFAGPHQLFSCCIYT